MIGFEQSVLFITAATFDKEYKEQLESIDRTILVSCVCDLCENPPLDFDSVFFVSENNCASLVSAHHMAELLEVEYMKRVRYMLLPADAWVDASKTLESVRAKSPFHEQLWVIIGSSEWVLRATNTLLPSREKIPDVSDIPSAVVICGYTYRNKELACLMGNISTTLSTELH